MSLRNLDSHHAPQLLLHYKQHSVLVKLSTPCWSKAKVATALVRGPHKSCGAHIDFLNAGFVDMIRRGQWVILLAVEAHKLKGLCVSLSGVVHMLLNKTDLSNGFYRAGLGPINCSKLGVAYPVSLGVKPIIAIPLVAPIGWRNIHPVFSNATEIVAAVTNAGLRDQTYTSALHNLDRMAVDAAPPPSLRAAAQGWTHATGPTRNTEKPNNTLP